VAHLDAAARGDGKLEGAVSWLLDVYWSRQGRPEEVRSARERTERWGRLAEAADAERRDFGPDDWALPHGLDDTTLDGLRATLARFPEIHEAWLVRKAIRHFPEDPFFVLALRAGPRLTRCREEQTRELVRKLGPELRLPGATHLVPSAGKPPRRVRDTPGSRVFTREA